MAANKILTKMKEHSESLVNQAIMVSDEQIRIAILWHEQWHEALEEASRLFFGERQVSIFVWGCILLFRCETYCKAVLGFRDILVRIRIPGSVPVTNTPVFFIFFFYL